MIMPEIWVLLVCSLCSVPLWTECAPAQSEYLIDLNVNLISTQNKEDVFVTRLQNEFHITFIQAFHVDSTRMLHVSTSEEDAATIAELPEINVIEKNEKAELAHHCLFCPKIPAPETWGLDRIDQTSKLDIDDPYDPNFTYFEGPYRGADVTAYIVDTGIDIEHPAFGNRAHWGYTVPGMGSNIDGYGHGTHVAGTVGATAYGVATEVTLIAVKVFNDNGDSVPWSVIISGIEWVFNHHNTRKETGGTMPKSVVNMSLRGGVSACADNAVKTLINAGIVVVVAAGNDNHDACRNSPGHATEVITVGASDITDTSASFSNWGSCVDLYAPGRAVKSTLPTAKGSFGFSGGTSMATPHVTGAVALKFSKDTVVKTPAQMASWLRETSTKNQLNFYNANHATSPNRLVHVNCKLADPLGLFPG